MPQVININPAIHPEMAKTAGIGVKDTNTRDIAHNLHNPDINLHKYINTCIT